MVIKAKCKVIIAIIGLVIILSAYFIFSPGNTKTDESADAKEMTDTVNDYNAKYNIYSGLYADIAAYGNNMMSDKLLTTEELDTYEEKLVTFIDASEDIVDACRNVIELIDKHSQHFQNTAETKAQFEDVNHQVDDQLNNIVIFVNMLRGVNKNTDEDKTLNDLSVELIKIRDG